jgi:hypothetical protein
VLVLDVGKDGVRRSSLAEATIADVCDQITRQISYRVVAVDLFQEPRTEGSTRGMVRGGHDSRPSRYSGNDER